MTPEFSFDIISIDFTDLNLKTSNLISYSLAAD